MSFLMLEQLETSGISTRLENSGYKRMLVFFISSKLNRIIYISKKQIKYYVMLETVCEIRPQIKTFFQL